MDQKHGTIIKGRVITALYEEKGCAPSVEAIERHFRAQGAFAKAPFSLLVPTWS